MGQPFILKKGSMVVDMERLSIVTQVQTEKALVYAVGEISRSSCARDYVLKDKES